MIADATLLAEVPLFKLLDDQEREEIANQLEIVQIPQGQTVYRHGDPGDSIFVIRRGAVEVFYNNNSGEKITLEHAVAGDFFGELSFLDNGSRSASVLVTEDLEALVMDRQELDAFLHRHPAAAIDILTSIGCRFRRMLERLQSAATRNLNEEMADQRGKIEKAADWIAAFSGSISFLNLHALVFAAWIFINLGYIPALPPFDPYPFGLLTMAVSLEAIFLSVFVLLSQNRQVQKDHVRADIEYAVNLRAELEINHLHVKLDRLNADILSQLDNLQKKLGSANK